MCLSLALTDCSAINSATGSPDGGSRPSKDDIRALLNQDWVQEKLRRAQDSVLQEFKVDADALAEALTRFHNVCCYPIIYFVPVTLFSVYQLFLMLLYFAMGCRRQRI